jgi:broad specificity phosphatase PhoE
MPSAPLSFDSRRRCRIKYERVTTIDVPTLNMPNRHDKITIIRHGESALKLPLVRITASEFREWIAEYNRTGLATGSYPPQTLVTALVDVPLIVCSDYPRAIESARRVVPGVSPRIMPLFREAGRPLDGHWMLKLPLSTWDCISVSLWRRGLISGSESLRSARQRARQAAEVLARFAEEAGWVLCVAHATFNSFVGQELQKFGWEGPDQTSDKLWEGATYSKESPGSAFHS